MNSAMNSAMNFTSGRRKLFRDETAAREFVRSQALAWIGSEVGYFDETDSTNLRAKGLAGRGGPDGGLLLAEHQTRGRGRLGRRWFCPPRAGLLVTVLVDRSRLTTREGQLALPWLTAAGALAMAGAAADACGPRHAADVLIDWPNDLVGPARNDDGRDACAFRKLGGVLVEAGVTGRGGVPAEAGPLSMTGRRRRPELLALGVGLNVDVRPEEFPPDIASTAGSLFTLFGTSPDRRDILGRFLRGLERRLSRPEEFVARLGAELRERSATLGREVEVLLDGEPKAALATGFDDQMRLVVELPDGRVEAVESTGVAGAAWGHTPLRRSV